MLETMYAAPGIGLAATQVDVHKRVLVVDVSEEQDHAAGLRQSRRSSSARARSKPRKAACRCPASSTRSTTRAARVVVRALGRDGKPFELEADGLLAICIQHEMDHLEGKLFVDYLSELKRTRIRKKLEKERRERALAAAATARPCR